MRIGLIFLFVAMPLLELAVLIKVGQWIGFWWTMLLLVATAIGGGLVVHAQGFAALRRMNEAVEHGRPPIEPVVDSVFLLFAGALMLTPGLITDAIGISLLIPWVRGALGRYVLRSLLASANVHVEMGTRAGGPPPGRADDRDAAGAGGPSRQQPGRQQPGRPQKGVVIEGEWEEVEEPRSPPPGSTRPGVPPAGGPRRPGDPPRT